MAKKQTSSKIRKPTKSQTRTPARPQPRRAQATAETSSLSVTDGAMKDVIRSAFLRREV
jgi:hypothetical protein